MTRVVLFDFDGVLIRGDSMGRVMRRLLSRSLLHKTLAYAATPVALPLLRGRSTMRLGAAIYFRIALALDREGRAVEAELAREQVEARAHWIEPAWARLAEHRAAGDRVIVVTGAPEVLVRGLLEQRGLAGLELVATQLERGARGWETRRHCYGPEKVAMLAERGIVAPWAVAYSDSDADIPMLTRADRAVIVSPRPRALVRLTRALPQAELVDW